MTVGISDRRQNAAQVVVLVWMRGELAANVDGRIPTRLAVGGRDHLVGTRMCGEVCLRRAGHRRNGGVHTLGTAVGRRRCGRRHRDTETGSPEQATAAPAGNSPAPDDTPAFYVDVL